MTDGSGSKQLVGTVVYDGGVGRAPGRFTRAGTWAVLGLLMTTVLVFAGIRLSRDVPNVLNGITPSPDSFERRYAENPFLFYAHILPGVLFMVLAPFQVSSRFRSGRISRHRRIGRVALGAGLVTGAFALLVGTLFPFGGFAEGSATVVFGVYFLVSLVLAYRAVRSGDIAHHRRWMVRAFAVGMAVGSIRILVGISEGFGILSFREAFGVAFWIAFVVHAIAAEIWLARYPNPPS